MTSVRRLKVVAGAGDPDDFLVLRSDVVAAAVGWQEACHSGDEIRVANAEERLAKIVSKYRAAVRRREGD